MSSKALLAAVCLGTLIGCEPSGTQRTPPTLIAERTNREGEVIQRIIRESSYATKATVLTPDGPRKKTDYKVEYFLEGKGKERRQLSVMRAPSFAKYETYRPVEGSSLWVGIGIDPVGNGNMLHVVLFDENRVIHERTFEVIPKWKSSKSEYGFDDGNRTIIFETADGPRKYDVQADTVAERSR